MEKSCIKDIIKQYLEKAYWKGTDLCPTGTSLDYRSMDIEIEGLLAQIYTEINDADMCGQALQFERQQRQEAEQRAETLVSFVTPELAELLERLVNFVAYSHTGDGYDYQHWFDEPFSNDPTLALSVARQIRDVLGVAK